MIAAVLWRGRSGEASRDAPLIRDIEMDPMLAGTKLIAEAWDAGGLYQVGSFAGERWCEWNAASGHIARRRALPRGPALGRLPLRASCRSGHRC
jgi:glycogen operon protein